MKYVKMLGLLTAAAAALMAFAGIASATTLTSPTGTTYTGTIAATSEGATSLDGTFTTVTCNASTVEGKVESHGASKTVAGKLSKLTFTECNFPTTVLKTGSLELHAYVPDVTGAHATCLAGPNSYCYGTLTSSGAEITIQTSVGDCVFTTSNTSVGSVTPTNITGATATMDINSSKIPRTGGNFLCGSSGTWTGSYKVNTPDSLWIDA